MTDPCATCIFGPSHGLTCEECLDDSDPFLGVVEGLVHARSRLRTSVSNPTPESICHHHRARLSSAVSLPVVVAPVHVENQP